MKHGNQGGVFGLGALLLALVLAVGGCVSGKPAQRVAAPPIMLVVLDPLAKELACACVKGYGQRDYRKLAAHLESVLQQPVAVEYSDDLAETLALASPGQEVIVVGERSLVLKSAKRAALPCHPVGALTDPD